MLRREGRSEAGGFLLAQSFIGAIDEPTHIPAVNELVGRFTGSVVATREHARLEVEADATEGVDNLERIFLGERQVVVGIDEKDFLAGSAGLFADDLWVVVAGADGGPQVADAVLRKASFFKRLFDVAALAEKLTNFGSTSKAAGKAFGNNSVPILINELSFEIKVGQAWSSGRRLNNRHRLLWLRLHSIQYRFPCSTQWGFLLLPTPAKYVGDGYLQYCYCR